MSAARNPGIVRTIPVILTIVALCPLACGRVIHVDDDAAGIGHGESWLSAYRYLQDALAEAEATGEPVEIRVAQGIYRPDRSRAFPNGTGDCETTFRLISGVTIKGGFAGIGAPDPNANDINLYETILSGDLAGNDVEVGRAADLIGDPTRVENSRHVVTASDTEPKAVLEGFTIYGGNAEPPPHAGESPSRTGGGGMLCLAGSPTLVRCTFTGNTAGNGGGLCCRLGNPRLMGCTFRRNMAHILCEIPTDFLRCDYGNGGALYAESGELLLEDCIFEGNLAYGGAGMFSFSQKLTLVRCEFLRNACLTPGPPVPPPPPWPTRGAGGLFHALGSVRLSECVFLGNQAHSGGGMILSDGAQPVLHKCVFRDNRAGLSGGALCSSISVGFEMTDCTVVGNQAGSYGGGVLIRSDRTVKVTRCTFSGNRATYGGALDIGEIDAQLVSCTFTGNIADQGLTIACHSYPGGSGSNLWLTNCILWNDGTEIDNSGSSVIEVTYSDVQGDWPGQGNIDADPLFADPGSWDPNGTPNDAADDFWIEGDYHLQSQAGRWDPVGENWAADEVTSPCIDAGDPTSSIGGEPFPNGGWINMGAYGGTAEASRSRSGIHAKYGGGSGTAADPYQIWTAEQMNAIGAEPNDWDKHFKLMADLDLSAYDGQDGRPAFNIIGCREIAFRGIFDGRGHVIHGFHWRSAEIDYVGIFGHVSDPDTEILALGLIDPDVDAGTGSFVGPLVGLLDEGTVTCCFASGGRVKAGGSVGGLIGRNNATVANSYAVCHVMATGTAGGLVGISGYWGRGPTAKLRRPEVFNCYAAGMVSGDTYTGGLTGLLMTGEIRFSFWDVDASHQSASGGGIGMTTPQMQDPNVFMAVGWDFFGASDGPSDIWTMGLDGGYPILWWQARAAQQADLPQFSSGTGAPQNPYLISSAQELNRIGHNPRLMQSHFRLVDDIDLAGIDFFPVGVAAMPFEGTFDGDGRAISNLTLRSMDGYAVGLFGSVKGSNAQVRNVWLVGPNVHAVTGTCVGSLVGTLKKGLVADCHTKGAMITGGDHTGGLAGCNDAGILQGCSSDCCVTGGEYTGGLVGSHWPNGLVTRCRAGGAVTGTKFVGGLAGFSGAPIKDCGSTASVTGTGLAREIGGLVGSNRQFISNCFASGSTVGDNTVGGLVGYHLNGVVINSYAMGSVTGTRFVGGLVASNSGTVVNSYASGKIIGAQDTGGLIPWHPSGNVIGCFWDVDASGQVGSIGGTGKTTAQMQTGRTFAAWNAWGDEMPWTIEEGQDYPRLRWEGRPGEPILPVCVSDMLVGKGTVDDPYLIATVGDLNVIGLYPGDWDKHFELTMDIDLSGYTEALFNVAGTAEMPFAGAFDGGGHTISHFQYSRDNAMRVGLFGYVAGPYAEIRNVRLTGCAVTTKGGTYTGALVGWLNNGTVSNCSMTGSVAGYREIGGLVGHLDGSGTMRDCHVNNDVNGLSSIGGLVGSSTGTIVNCSATSRVSGHSDTGGLVGQSSSGTIAVSCSTGTVAGFDSSGGLVGNTSRTIVTNCYSTSTIAGKDWGLVGGLVGVNFSGAIANCYSTGGTRGLVGYSTPSLITGSFWERPTSGQTVSVHGTGKTTAEMQMASTFLNAGWDFVGEVENGTEDIWWILEGQDYPRLWWEAAEQ